MIPKGKILIVDDNEDVLLSINLLLRDKVEAVKVTTNPEKIEELMSSFSPDVILLDMNFQRDACSGEEGFMWLRRILEMDPHALVLFLTAYVTTEKAVRAIKAGALDFIPKPWDKEKLLETIRNAVALRDSSIHDAQGAEHNQEQQTKKSVDRVSSAIDPKCDMIGESSCMQEVKKQIARVATTDANVLITGENGTGKDVVAHLLHLQSGRASRPLVSIDLGSLPENLFEGELFGYEKGAFTDAQNAKEGRMEAANGGTLFLDEIGNLSMMMQQKLLTVLEKRETTRLGSTKVTPIDVRLICATNAHLKQRVHEHLFRQDLLYRINTIEIHLPPLRERGNDILLLAEHFLKQMARQYNRPVPSLSAETCQLLRQHTWPGNVRELLHTMERAVILSDKSMLMPEDIPLEAVYTPASNSLDNATLNLEDLERQAIMRAISIHDGNLTLAAETLGISRYTLYRKIEKLGL